VGARNEEAVGRGVWSSESLVAMLVPSINSTDVVAGIASKFTSVVENVIEVESESFSWS
jgi:hypothetical protein